MSRASTLARAALIGGASGARSLLGIAALAVSARGRLWGAPYSTGLAVLASGGEFVGDKLPQTPSRLSAPTLAGRLVLGGVSGVVLARRDGADTSGSVAAGLVAAAGAGAASWGGAAWRDLAQRRFGADLPGALIEDAAAITLAASAVRR